MSIFEYDAEKEYEKMRHTIRRAALAEGHNEGYAEGRNDGRNEGYAEGQITLIRKKHQTGKSTAEIISALELEESFVKAVTEILNQSPELSDGEITELILSNKANN